MRSRKRGASGRHAAGRGRYILRFEPLEGRQLLSTGTTTSTTPALTSTVGGPVLVQTQFQSPATLNWGQSFQVTGSIQNQGSVPGGSLARVDVYASNGPYVDTNSVLLGSISLPNGLAIGQNYAYSQQLQLPSTALTGFAGNQIYLNARVDLGNSAGPDLATPALGQGIDQTLVTIAPATPANLVSTVFQVTPAITNWGSQVGISAQIANTGQMNAAASTAEIILTPSGAQPGAGSDFTVGAINVPAIAAGQSITVNQPITLPASFPKILQGNSQFTMSIVLDTNYSDNQWYPHLPLQGSGQDQAPIEIATTSSTVKLTVLPHLEVKGIQTPSLPMNWGQSFQATAVVQNVGTSAASNVRVDFVFLDPSVWSQAIYLGSAIVPSLPVGMPQTITQTLNIPSLLPDGSTPPQIAQGKIAAIVDPQHQVDQTTYANNTNYTGTVTLTSLDPNSVQSYINQNTTASSATPAAAPTKPSKTTLYERNLRHQEVLAALKAEKAAKLAEHQQAVAARMAQRRATLKLYPTSKHGKTKA